MHTLRDAGLIHRSWDVLFFVFVVLRPKSTAMVMAGRSVHLPLFFLGQQLTSTLCTYFRL